jgi:hypothetical protein
MSLRRSVLALLCGLAVAVAASPIRSEQATWTDTEISAGAETIGRAWSTYLTVIQAPWSGTTADGLRFRTGVSYGRSSAGGVLTVGAHHWPARFTTTRVMSEALVGYQYTAGPVILKAFAGMSGDGEWTETTSPASLEVTKRISFKGIIEAWWTLAPEAYLQADLQWRAITDGAQARVRYGRAVLAPDLFAGLEAGASAGADYETARAGGFLRYAPAWGEVSISGGIGGERGHADKP